MFTRGRPKDCGYPEYLSLQMPKLTILFLKSLINLILDKKEDLILESTSVTSIKSIVTVNICCSITIVVLEVFRENNFVQTGSDFDFM